jgi:hypothetical protein
LGNVDMSSRKDWEATSRARRRREGAGGAVDDAAMRKRDSWARWRRARRGSKGGDCSTWRSSGMTRLVMSMYLQA